MEEYIEVQGANEHNLKNVHLTIPRNKLVVFTGLSGSGKSSLAFDTIYAEGQRRYIESFSAYARQFLGNMKRPNVERILGLSPVVSIEQKTTSKSPRSTVGTTTELYDLLRLLYARIATAYSLKTGEEMVKMSDQEITRSILEKYNGEPVNILAPLVIGRKGHYRELFERLSKQGFLKVRIDDEIVDITPGMMLNRYQTHDIDVVIDRLKAEDNKRLRNSIELALKRGKGSLSVLPKNGEGKFYSRNLMCPTSGEAYPDPEPNLFSFNSPYGYCKRCKGLGELTVISPDKSIKDPNKSLNKGGFELLGNKKQSWYFAEVHHLCAVIGIDPEQSISSIPNKKLDLLLKGINESDQIIKGVYEIQTELLADKKGDKYADYLTQETCHECNGDRLNPIALQFKLLNKNIAEVAKLDLKELQVWLSELENNVPQNLQVVANEILKEINNKIQFLLDVGLHYLNLNRPMKTLSGGEAQRIRLATQIGSKLVGILYILDEPSIGLHQRDNRRLIQSLKNLRDIGNSIIVVEHDEEIIRESDYLIDIGPKAGLNGGEIVFAGESNKVSSTLTGDYLLGNRSIITPSSRRKPTEFIQLNGASGNNLKNVNLKLPLGVFTAITGVSGSGKSSLINGTLTPVIYNHFYKSNRKPLSFKSIKGLENIDKIIQVDQSPIGRTPRSNPATYTGVFTDIRKLFAELPESKIRGYSIGRFSFNVKGGRCETCKGAGMQTIEMNFLPDVLVNCDDCQGKRYNRETLEVRYKGKSITDVLNMSIEESVTFFKSHPKIYRLLNALLEVGLGYISLGQSSTTLSGGEAQRVKLATELAKKDTGKTLYILDEPTTGLHFEDINTLLKILHRLVDRGNSVVVIEHNLDVVKTADHVIDLGHDGGMNGGQIVFQGTPEKMIKDKKSITASFLSDVL